MAVLIMEDHQIGIIIILLNMAGIALGVSIIDFSVL